MANTFTKMHIHFVFAVKHRAAMIDAVWKTELYKYMTGIVRNCEHDLIVINGMPDHVHLLVTMKPKQSVSELIKLVKGMTSKWINEKKFCTGKFEWQEGFGAFSYGASQLPVAIEYIKNQEQHHEQKIFVEEYKAFLKSFNVDYDDRYVFTEPE